MTKSVPLSGAQTSQGLLMIAYYFPPTGGSATIRSLKFARYLPAYGWTPTVVSVRKAKDEPQDPNLLRELPPEAIVYRTWHLDPADMKDAVRVVWGVLWRARLRGLAQHLAPHRVLPWLCVPDDKITWLLPAFRTAMRAIRQQPIHAIYSTSLPASAHLIGLCLKLATGLPWIADFRDEWTQNPYITYPSRLHGMANRRLEHWVLKRADTVTATTDAMSRGLAELLPQTERHKFVTVMNGYDEHDFQHLQDRARKHNLRFEMAYVGTLYGLRSAGILLQALDSLVKDGSLSAVGVRLRIIGKSWTDELRQYEGCEWLEVTGHVAHSQAVQFMWDADLLVLLDSSETKVTVPAKLFEYMAVQRPVLALTPQTSVAASILTETRAGVVVPPEDVDAVRCALMEAYQSYARDETWTPPSLEVVRQYERRRQAGRLAELLDSLIPVHPAARAVPANILQL